MKRTTIDNILTSEQSEFITDAWDVTTESLKIENIEEWKRSIEESGYDDDGSGSFLCSQIIHLMKKNNIESFDVL